MSMLSRFSLLENFLLFRSIWLFVLIYYLQFKRVKKNGLIAILFIIASGLILPLFGNVNFINYKILVNAVFITFCIYAEFNYRRGNKLLKYYLYYFVINGVLAIIGLIFDIYFFRSEPTGLRFGFTGLLPMANNELFYLMLIFAYIKAPLKFSFFKDSLLILAGLKSSFIAFFILKRKYYYLIVPVIVFLLLYNLDEIILSSGYLDYFLYFYRREGFIYMMTSGRLERSALFDLSFFPSRFHINYESDPITLIYNFGIFLSLPIFMIYIKLLKIFIKLKQFDLFFLFVGGIFFMGHFIDSILALSLVVLYLQCQLKLKEPILN
jgi:hypothetical protein